VNSGFGHCGRESARFVGQWDPSLGVGGRNRHPFPLRPPSGRKALAGSFGDQRVDARGGQFQEQAIVGCERGEDLALNLEGARAETAAARRLASA
jgi:hypothetical protein